MLSIYQYDSYKKYFNDWVKQQPKNGHGEYRRLAAALGVSTTMVSQIFNGDKDLSLELACEMTEYLLFNDDDADYFLLLVDFSKAGSVKLRSRLSRQIKDRQGKAKKLENRFKNVTTLSESERNVYYSTWINQAIRILIELEDSNTIDSIVNKIAVPKNQVMKAVEFLNKVGLVNQKGNKLFSGDSHVYLPSSDPIVGRYHWNWRQLAIQKMQVTNDETFFYSGQYTLSNEVADEIRRLLPDLIKSVVEKVKPSKSQTARCLNIDYFDL